MHQLVYRAIKVWMQKQGILEPCLAKTVSHLANKCRSLRYEDWETRRKYIPHVIRVLQNAEVLTLAQRADLYLHLTNCLTLDSEISGRY